jgi:glycosyltransferase involved in cell wall biosynthesis
MLGRFASKSLIIENAPYDPGPELAARVPVAGPIRLHLGGYLSKRRMGLETLLQAIDLLPPGSVVIEASGWLLDDFAKDVFAKHPAVNYRWLAKPIDFLACAASCDALLYLRSDAEESPYRAAVRPNRVFDAMAVGRPLIVNPELGLARWVREENLGIVLPRFDAPTLAEIFRSLEERRAKLPQEAARLRGVFLDGHVWPVMQQKLGALYAQYQERQTIRRKDKSLCGATG